MFDYIAGRRVLVTGHTGFCGTWLTAWLKELGADVYGLAKAPETTPAIFSILNVLPEDRSMIADISEPGRVAEAFAKAQPEIVFHLAAQPLVRQSYFDPLETYRSNVIGTAEICEAIRQSETVKAAVLVTTDKVYHNREWVHPYRETDRLGGKDPYSASKAACELVVSSYIDTVFDAERVLCATARGGNIIGGGDWSADRLIPDIVRAITTDETLVIRNPNATRPWQHVLALCHAYIALAERLFAGEQAFQGGWNFGPMDQVEVPTRQLVEAFAEHWAAPKVDIQSSQLHEAQLLALDCTKARRDLAWTPGWSTPESISRTADWYKAHAAGEDMQAFTKRQIDDYRAALSG